MTKKSYALFIDGEYKEVRDLNARPADIEHKNVKWHPVKDEVREGEDFGWVIENDHAIRTRPAQKQTDPLEIPLSKRKLLIGLLPLQVTESMIDQAIEDLPESPEKELARIDWRYPEGGYNYTHPLVATVMGKLGLNAKQAEAQWKKMVENGA